MTYTLVEERRSKKVNTLLAELRSRLSAKLIKEPIEEIGYAITVELDSWEQTQCEVLEVVKNQNLESWQDYVDLIAEKKRQYYMCVEGYHHDRCYCQNCPITRKLKELYQCPVPNLAYGELEPVEIRLLGHYLRIVDYVIMVGNKTYEVGASLQLDYNNVPSLFVGLFNTKHKHGGLGVTIEQEDDLQCFPDEDWAIEVGQTGKKGFSVRLGDKYFQQRTANHSTEIGWQEHKSREWLMFNDRSKVFQFEKQRVQPVFCPANFVTTSQNFLRHNSEPIRTPTLGQRGFKLSLLVDGSVNYNDRKALIRPAEFILIDEADRV